VQGFGITASRGPGAPRPRTGEGVRWRVDADGDHPIELVEELRALDDVEPIDIGEETNAVEVEFELGRY